MRAKIAFAPALLTAVQAHVKANPGKASAAQTASFDASFWPEWAPRPEFVTWETLFAAPAAGGAAA